MKNFPLAILAVIVLACLGACKGKDSIAELNEKYSEWKAENDKWLDEQKVKTNADGSLYYTKVTPRWNPEAYVLIHYYNDPQENAGNLTPMFTSTIDTRYYASYCNGVPMDSSYLQTAYGPGIFRTQLSKVITGWAIAFETMHVGDTAEIIIPYESAYGTSSNTVLPYSNLKFNVRLVDIPAYEINPDAI